MLTLRHLLIILQRPDEAYTQAKLALDLDPLNPLIQGLYGVVLWDKGDYDLAIVQGRKALSVVPNHFLALEVVDGSNFLNGNYEKSFEALIRTLPLDTETIPAIQKTFDEQGLPCCHR